MTPERIEWMKKHANSCLCSLCCAHIMDLAGEVERLRAENGKLRKVILEITSEIDDAHKLCTHDDCGVVYEPDISKALAALEAAGKEEV